MGFRSASVILATLVTVGLAAAGSGPRTQITVWAATTPATANAYGGYQYGGYAPTTGAMISEQREIDVGSGEVRIAGVAATIDPASVQLHDATDPQAIVTEQRFVPGATTPTEILARHVGDAVTVVTQKGDVAGVLRSVDDQALVVEVGQGDQRHLQVMRRDGYVQDVRLPATAAADKPSLVWRVQTKKPGKHTLDVSYRAENISWTADYLAVLDEPGKSVDFSAWATVKNSTGATFENAELTLINGGSTTAVPTTATPFAIRPPPAPVKFVVPSPVRLGAGESVQVELLKPKAAAKARSIVTFEAMPDPGLNLQYQGQDCNQLNGTAGAGVGHAEIAVELDLPTQTALPDGKVRLFRHKGDRLEVVSEDPLRSMPGMARIRLAADTDITGERKAVTCNYDEHAKRLDEKIEVVIENKSKQAADVVVREFMWRYPVWKIEAQDQKGALAGPQTQEYRLHVPATGKQTLTYTVVYTW
jgi:hypothetical protein